MEIENAEARNGEWWDVTSFGRRICKSAVEWVAKAVSKGPARKFVEFDRQILETDSIRIYSERKSEVILIVLLFLKHY